MIKVYVRQADCLTAEEVSVVDALMAKTFGALEFIEFLSQIKDHRRAEGKKRKLVKLLFATILAVLSGAIFYCKIHRYIKANREKLNDAFGFGWYKVPAYSSIRFVLQGLDDAEIESKFRKYSALLSGSDAANMQVLAIDGKVLNGKFKTKMVVKRKAGM